MQGMGVHVNWSSIHEDNGRLQCKRTYEQYLGAFVNSWYADLWTHLLHLL